MKLSEIFLDRLLGGFLKIFAEILLKGFLKIFAEILLEGFPKIFSEIFAEILLERQWVHRVGAKWGP